MDFLNPKKQRQRKIQLIIGYILIFIAISLATLVMLFWAYGYGIGKNGEVVQDGLLFLASSPSPANIYIDNVLNSSTTNSRLQLQAGNYSLELTRSGYRPWFGNVTINGDSVLRVGYPYFFPTKIITTTIASYLTQPGLMLQPPNGQLLLVQQPDGNDFSSYNLSNPKQVAPTLTTISVPAGILTNPNEPASWKLVGWAGDNVHVLLKRTYSTGSEYILMDIQNPSASINLTKTLALNSTTTVQLDNLQYDHYYLLDSSNGSLSEVTLSQPHSSILLLSNVSAYKSYGSNIVYATTTGAPSGNVNVNFYDGSQSYIIRHIPTDTSYLLDMEQYNGNLYVACGSPATSEVYVYMNPTSSLSSSVNQTLVPVDILRANDPNYLEFAPGGQYIIDEGGNTFAVYDAMNNNGYNYQLHQLSIAGDLHASWMDGAHLYISSGGSVSVWDYNGTNYQTLQPAVTGSIVLFDPTEKWAYVIAGSSSSGAPYHLTSTALRIPADQ